MAKYDYACLDCKHTFEIEMSYSAFDKARSKKKACPQCKSNKTSRFIHTPHHVVYNGTGFFSTDQHKTMEINKV